MRIPVRWRPNPLTVRKLQRFRRIRRGYWSFIALCVLVALSLIAELLVNNRALVVRHGDSWHFPTYGAISTGRDFGLGYDHEVDYRQLRELLRASGDGFVILPPVPWNAVENCYPGEVFKPRPPDPARGHWLGTDQLNRDILARLLYGFRNALIFSSAYFILTFLIGVGLGAAMGWFGGWVDLVGQRLIEIWSLIPFLFVVIIVGSIVSGFGGLSLGWLLAIVVLFSWTPITYYIRANTYREKSRDYVLAARALGASTPRILFNHVLPNVLSTVVTFAPFTVAASISALTALDFLGYGLPPPTPSWGELLRQGTSNLGSPWIVASAFTALVTVLILVTFVGEAVREAFDPKTFTLYR